MEKIRTFLFDLDGTLLDSKRALTNVIYGLCQKYGVASTYEEVESQFSLSFRQILEQFEASKRKEVLDDYFKWMLQAERSPRLFPAIRENLQFLRCRGNRLALVTNKERLIVEENFKRLRLEGLFDAVVTSCDVQTPKPSAEPLEKALALLRSPKEEAIMVGDSLLDVQAAYNARIPSAVLDWYQDYPLEQLRPTYYFHDISEMMASFYQLTFC